MTHEEIQGAAKVWNEAEERAVKVCDVLNAAGFMTDRETVMALILIAADIAQDEEEPVDEELFVEMCRGAYDFRRRVYALQKDGVVAKA